MRTQLNPFGAAAVLLALPLAFSPEVSAQEPTQEVPQCVATVEPVEIQAGQAAVQVTATLSEEIGEVNAFTGPEDSGLALADPADIPRVDMANPEEEPQPIVLTPETNSVALWLTTADVAPGVIEAQLESEEGSCTAQLVVVE